MARSRSLIYLSERKILIRLELDAIEARCRQIKRGVKFPGENRSRVSYPV